MAQQGLFGGMLNIPLLLLFLGEGFFKVLDLVAPPYVVGEASRTKLPISVMGM